MAGSIPFRERSQDIDLKLLWGKKELMGELEKEWARGLMEKWALTVRPQLLRIEKGKGISLEKILKGRGGL